MPPESSKAVSKQKIVVAGLGDTGILTVKAILRSRKCADFEVVAITPKPCFVSGQELGTRITDPELWKESVNGIRDFAEFKALRDARLNIIQGLIVSLDATRKVVTVRKAQFQQECRVVHGEGDVDIGTEMDIEEIKYDAFLIATGVTNGWWRNTTIERREEVEKGIYQVHQQVRCPTIFNTRVKFLD